MSDRWVLDIVVQGYTLLPNPSPRPFSRPYSATLLLVQEVEKLLGLGAVEEVP